MAYAFGFPRDVTDAIYSMRDWRWEMVRDGGKTPSARCFTTKSRFLDPSDYPHEKPLVWVYNLPQVDIESDEEEADYGEVRNSDRTIAWYNDVCIRIHDDKASYYRMILLRQQGKTPVSFQRLQYQNDRRILEIWFGEPR